MRKECYLFIWLLVEAHISRWALSASQRQLHSAILCFRADPYRSSRMRLWMSDCSFSQRVLNVSCVLSVDMAGATWNCCRLGARSVCTIQPCTCLQYHFIPSHTRRVHVWLAVTWHLHFWQNNQVLSPAAATVTRGWNGYWNISQHRKLTLEKIIHPPVLEPETFDHDSDALTTELSRSQQSWVFFLRLSTSAHGHLSTKMREEKK